ncbi:MAG: hypothetical protein JSR66_23120 [Proteobacteria bacterium]|nr:hypothetical protein [Pseudomonadota bacterium]
MRYQDSARALLTMVAFSLVGNTVLAVQPMVVGGLVDYLHFSQREAGLVASAELTGFSLAGMALLTFVHRVDRRVLAYVGIAIVVTADLIACAVKTFPLMFAVRMLAGAGSAIAYAIFPVLAASSSRPERVFGLVNATSIGYAGAFVWVAPKLMELGQLPGIFLSMGAIALLVSPTILWTPASLPAAAGREPVGRLNISVVLLLAATLCLYVGHGGIWAYQERIGIAAGIPKQRIGSLLGSSMLIWGVAGSLLATWLGLAWGRVRPQILALVLSVFAAILLVVGADPLTYGLACALIAFSWFFGLPYLSGWLAALDPQGRANIACVLVSTLGSALGPALAAALLGGQSGYAAIAVVAGACYLSCLVLVIIVAIASQAAAVTSSSDFGS